MLPPPELDNFTRHLIHQLPIISSCKDDNKLLSHTIYGCCKTFNFSFCEIAKYLDDINDFLVTNGNRSCNVPDIYFPIIVYLLALKRRKSDAYIEVLVTQNMLLGEIDITNSLKCKIWPIDSLNETEKKVLDQIAKIFFSSNDEADLIIAAYGPQEIIKNMQNRTIQSHEQPYYQALNSLSRTIIDVTYGGFNQTSGAPYHTRNNKDYYSLRAPIKHFEIAVQIISFLTSLNETVEVTDKRVIEEEIQL